MTQIYAPWFAGISNEAALRALKQSAVIDGVELSGRGEDTEAIRSAGLKVSLHNPLRESGTDLSDADFEHAARRAGIRAVMDRLDTDFVGFHLGFTRIHQARSVEAMFRAAVKNIAYLNTLTDKTILFETPSYFLRHAGTGIGDVFDAVTSPAFIKRVLHTAQCGFLLDVPHVFISGITKELTGQCRFDEYVDELIGGCAPFVRALHISAPRRETGDGFSDAHGFLTPKEDTSRLIIDLCRRSVSRCPHISAVTLEMRADGTADGNTNRLIEQARFVLAEIIPHHGRTV